MLICFSAWKILLLWYKCQINSDLKLSLLHNVKFNFWVIFLLLDFFRFWTRFSRKNYFVIFAWINIYFCNKKLVLFCFLAVHNSSIGDLVTDSLTDWGKTPCNTSAVQTEFYRKGGGVENPFQMECGSSSVNINYY